MVSDDVAHQKHYINLDPEPIVILQKWMSKAEFCGYLRGNIIKYIARYPMKGGIEDLRKILVYTQWLIEAESNENIKIPENEV